MEGAGNDYCLLYTVFFKKFCNHCCSLNRNKQSCMKKLMILALAFVCTAGVVSAQDTSGHKMHKMGDHKMKDCVMMKDGKVMVMKDGQKSELTDDMTLSNGTTVMKDGTVKTSDGKTMMLKNGDWVGMDGQMGKMGKMKGKDKMTSDSAK
jgi:hypothetical protein